MRFTAADARGYKWCSEALDMLRAKQCLHDMFQLYRILFHDFATALNGLLEKRYPRSGQDKGRLGVDGYIR